MRRSSEKEVVGTNFSDQFGFSSSIVHHQLLLQNGATFFLIVNGSGRSCSEERSVSAMGPNLS